MIFNVRIILALSFLLATTIYAQAQSHVCYVRYSYIDTQTKMMSSFFGLGEFSISAADETITKSFYHDESKVMVNVGVEFPSKTVGNKNAGLIIAIAFTGKPEDVFDEVGRAEAQATGRNPLKSSLLLSKSIETENRIWKFHLSCVPWKECAKW